MKRTAIIKIMIVIFVLMIPVQGLAQPEVSSETALLMDMKTGQILYQKNANQRMYPASTTKILTALVAIKKGNLNDGVLISHKAASIEGSAVGLQEGEVVKLGDLLYAVMLSSANDAAMAVAEHIGGTQEGFAQLMNDEAQAMGAMHSHFVTPNGLHHPDHYTTASDMALIAQEAMKNSLFRKYVSTYSHHISRTLPKSVSGIPQEDYANLNKLISPNSMYRYPGATGIKTGFTDEAGNCLVASAQRDGREFLAVVMKTPDRNGIFVDSAALLDYGFNEFKPVLLVGKGDEQGAAQIRRGETDTVGAVTADDYFYDTPLTALNVNIEKKIQLDKAIEAPVLKGQKIGIMTFFLDGKEIGRMDLVSDSNVERASFFRWWHGAAFAGFLLVFSRSRVRSKRRRYYIERRRRYYQDNW